MKCKLAVSIVSLAALLTVNPAYSEKKEKVKNYPLTDEQRTAIKKISERRALQKTFPTAEAVIDHAELVDDLDRAASIELTPPKRIIAKPFTIQARPAAYHREKIRTVNVYPNQITTFTFVDSMGEAWPLKANPIVASASYVVHYNAQIPGVFTLETTAKYTPSSLAVLLKGRVKPVQFQLRNNGAELNHDVPVTVKGRSPSNQVQVVTETFNIPSLNEGDAISFLRSPPDDASRLNTIGDSQTKVWAWKGKCVIKTPHEVKDSGSPISVQSEPDNIDKIWVFESLSTVVPLMVIENGEFVRVQIISGEC
jgi:hypothetical protein